MEAFERGGGVIANFEFVHNHWGGNSNLSEEMLFYDKRHGRYTSIGDKNNWIIEISANRIKENGKIVLILPDVGKVEKWNKLEFGHSTNYEARLVTINVCIGGQWQDINAIAVKNSLFSIYYWAKGYGLLWHELNGKITMYNSILTPNDIFENNLRFKEVPYYNVEQRQREEQAKREREKKSF